MKPSKINIDHIAALSNLHVTQGEKSQMAGQFKETLKAVDLLERLDTSKVKETSQVTGQINRYRPDKIDLTRVLSQSQALSNASQTHNGFIVVPAIF